MITERSCRNSPAPSTRDASMTSAGTSSRNERSIHTAIGRFIAVYRTTSSRWWSSTCRSRAMTYSGMIAPTIGSIFVEMKKNSTSRHLRTGRIDSA